MIKELEDLQEYLTSLGREEYALRVSSFIKVAEIAPGPIKVPGDIRTYRWDSSKNQLVIATSTDPSENQKLEKGETLPVEIWSDMHYNIIRDGKGDGMEEVINHYRNLYNQYMEQNSRRNESGSAEGSFDEETERRVSQSEQEMMSAYSKEGWNPAWGKKNAWDTKYGNVLPNKKITFNWGDLDPNLSSKLKDVFKEMEERGFDPIGWEGARSQARQAFLYGQGRPNFYLFGRAGSQVTKTLDASLHGASPAKAVDVISKSKGWGDMNFFKNLGEVAKKHGLKWGGDWAMRDYPHVQI